MLILCYAQLAAEKLIFMGGVDISVVYHIFLLNAITEYVFGKRITHFVRGLYD